jgi:RNA-directed DNA polymerase
VKHEKVLQRLYDPGRLRRAWQQVRENAAAAGIDRMPARPGPARPGPARPGPARPGPARPGPARPGPARPGPAGPGPARPGTVEEFERRQKELLDLIHEKLKARSCRFKPARRVLIPKESTTSKMRKLAVRVVMDRIVRLSTAWVLEEIFDPDFTGSNFGFRRGRSQHRAIGHVRDRVREGYEWCASIDLESFFDEIPHDFILKLIRRKPARPGIADERLVTLIARALKAGVIVEGKFEKTTKGCPQGSPLSPMLSNIVLNELDQELERRGDRYARWADDILILLKSERAAKRVIGGIVRYLEEDLGLAVNREKSEVAKVKDVPFAGFQILRGKIRVSDKARAKFKDKVRKLT